MRWKEGLSPVMLRRILITVLTLLVACQAALADDGQPLRKLTTQELAQWIDERFAAEYILAKVESPPLVDDATFLRRLFLDLQGHIPAVAQTRDFLSDDGSFKRQDCVDRLLN